MHQALTADLTETPPGGTKRQRAEAATAAGYAARRAGGSMHCPADITSPLEQLWWTRGWLARLAEEPAPTDTPTDTHPS